MLMLALVMGATSGGVQASHDKTTIAFRTYGARAGWSSSKILRSPFRDTAGSDAFPTVTSKWNQPRRGCTGCSDPHLGSDLQTDSIRPVYPIWSGWVVYNSNPGDGISLVIQLDLNQNNQRDDNAYVHYRHLSWVDPSIPTGSGLEYRVEAINLVAKSGTYGTGPHLHFGVVVDFSGPNLGQEKWVSNERYYRNNSTWNYGRDLDFLSNIYFYSNNYMTIWGYPKDSDYPSETSLPQGAVRLWHRTPGGVWNGPVDMTKSGNAWVADLGALGYSRYTTIQVLVSAWRDQAGTRPEKTAWFPPKYYHPGDVPTSSFRYLTWTIQ